MILAQISDTHIDPADPNNDKRVRALERCIDDINRLDPLPDAVIHTGDLVHNGSAAKYRIAARLLAALHCPVYVAPGNRDDRTTIRAEFIAGRELLPDTPFVQYVVDDHPVRLIGLDTLSPTTNMGDFCDTRADSLKAALTDGGKPTALFMHHPPFEVRASKYRWQFDSRDSIDRMRRALEGRDRVVRAFCGHAHRMVGGRIAGVPVSSTPSVAIDLRLGDYPEEAASAPLYQVHRYDSRDGFTSELRAAS